jgi:hypothetical protein
MYILPIGGGGSGGYDNAVGGGGGGFVMTTKTIPVGSETITINIGAGGTLGATTGTVINCDFYNKYGFKYHSRRRRKC